MKQVDPEELKEIALGRKYIVVDPALAAFIIKELKIVKEADLRDLAWAIDKGPCASKQDAQGLYDLLDQYIKEDK